MRDLKSSLVVTFTGLLPADPTPSTSITPSSGALLDHNGGLPRRSGVLEGSDRVVAMDAYKMPAQIMFTTK